MALVSQKQSPCWHLLWVCDFYDPMKNPRRCNQGVKTIHRRGLGHIIQYLYTRNSWGAMIIPLSWGFSGTRKFIDVAILMMSQTTMATESQSYPYVTDVISHDGGQATWLPWSWWGIQARWWQSHLVTVWFSCGKLSSMIRWAHPPWRHTPS